MRFFQLLVLCLFALSINAQPTLVNKRWLLQQDSVTIAEVVRKGWASSALDKGASIHIMPLSLFNGLPRLRVGAQYKPNRLSYLLDVEYGNGFGLPLFDMLGFRDYRFWGIRPEIRYDLSAFRPGWYVGLEAATTFMKREVDGRKVLGDTVFDTGLQVRNRGSVVGKIGFQFLTGKNFFVDFYGGLGVALEHYEYQDIVGWAAIFVVEPIQLTHIQEIRQDLGLLALVDYGRRWKPEVALGLRVGWWL